MNFPTVATVAVPLEGTRAMPIEADFVEYRDVRASRLDTGKRCG